MARKAAELEAATQTVDDESMAAVLSAFVEHAFSCDAHEFEGRYVDAFDFSEETNLNLTSQSCKDERQQRMTLLGYSLYFENAGATPGRELPDYLSSLLELSAAVDAGTAARILRRAAVHAHRAHVQRRHRRVQVSRSQGDRVPPPQSPGRRACRRVAKLPEGDAPGSRGFTFGAAHVTRGAGQPKGDGSEGRERHPRLNLRRGLPEMPPNAPRETDFAAEQPEGDGFGADFVTLGGSHGARTRQMARGAPRGTADAVNQPKGGRRGRQDNPAPVCPETPLIELCCSFVFAPKWLGICSGFSG